MIATLLPALLAGCAAAAQVEIYRGNYTYGHEVNVFCPAINSQCYWLGPNSSMSARAKLKQVYEGDGAGMYEPVCVVIEGAVDRDTPRDGFAVDYDGLIDVEKVHGSCEHSTMIIPSDLNHRRWVLVARDNAPVDAGATPVVLDFGERLFITGQDGCQRFSGFAELQHDAIILNKVEFDRSQCSDGDLAAMLFTVEDSWRVTFEGQVLQLEHSEQQLVFKRDDWK